MRFGSLGNLIEKIRSRVQIKQQKTGYSFSRGSSPSPSCPNPISLPASSGSPAFGKASKQKQGKSQPKEQEKTAEAGPKAEVGVPSSLPAVVYHGLEGSRQAALYRSAISIQERFRERAMSSRRRYDDSITCSMP